MRGRHPAGPEYVHKLDGSQQAKERLHTILEVVSGDCRVLEACRRLEVSEPRFHQLRIEALQAALANLEARPAGRPCRADLEATERLRALEEEVQALRIELHAAQTRAELALTLPHLAAQAEQKKTTRQTPATLRTARHGRRKKNT